MSHKTRDNDVRCKGQSKGKPCGKKIAERSEVFEIRGTLTIICPKCGHENKVTNA